MESSTSRRPTVALLQRIIWNRWRTSRVRVEYFPGLTTLEILQQINPEQFEDRIMFMSMSNDIGWTKKNLKTVCPIRIRITQKKRFPRGHWSCLCPREEDKWYGTHNNKPQGKWHIAAGAGESKQAPGNRTQCFEALRHSCVTPENAIESDGRPFRRVYSDWRKEVE